MKKTGRLITIALAAVMAAGISAPCSAKGVSRDEFSGFVDTVRENASVPYTDYDKYESSIFDPQAKAAYREEMFPQQCAAAYELGKSLLER